MSADLVLANPPGSIEADPTGYMTAVLEHGKQWLAGVEDIDDVCRTKATATGYEAALRDVRRYTDQMREASKAQILATELVRRCERRVGQLVVQGQAEGTIRKPGEHARKGDYELPSPSEFIGKGQTADHYRTLANADPEDFEEAIHIGKAERNLSRANVVLHLTEVFSAIIVDEDIPTWDIEGVKDFSGDLPEPESPAETLAQCTDLIHRHTELMTNEETSLDWGALSDADTGSLMDAWTNSNDLFERDVLSKRPSSDPTYTNTEAIQRLIHSFRNWVNTQAGIPPGMTQGVALQRADELKDIAAELKALSIEVAYMTHDLRMAAANATASKTAA